MIEICQTVFRLYQVAMPIVRCKTGSPWTTAVLCPTAVGADRVSIAMAARSDPQFVIMARTDALPTDAERGYDAAIERARVR